ncbi:hypothetical protein ElyMa_003034200 [Elysia marginata]|uniref:Uncharacterized protein n=1 Tax=Elysia marginata TaxID=1093978 RepID=A0AAV4II31_9GAST|nr:hypothetical protein ElyMa_003034200 [Elysia marginata]
MYTKKKKLPPKSFICVSVALYDRKTNETTKRPAGDQRRSLPVLADVKPACHLNRSLHEINPINNIHVLKGLLPRTTTRPTAQQNSAQW